MTGSRRRLGLAPVAVSIAGICLGATAVGGPWGLASSSKASPSSQGAATPPPKSLEVRHVSSRPVAPGVAGSVTIEVHNPNPQPVTLTRVTGTVRSVTTRTITTVPACSKDWIALEPWSAQRVIPGRGRTTVSMVATFTNLPTTNQDNCKGVTYTYDFTATGSQS